MIKTPLQSSFESVEQFARSGDCIDERSDLEVCEQRLSSRQFELSIEFSERPKRNSNVPEKCAVTSVGVPFCNVARY